jgi:hypothetical protein
MVRRINMEDTCETKASCMQKMVNKIKGSVPELIGIVIGAAGGFIYYKTVGCSTGSCPITSNPWLSIIWGTVLGYLFGSMFNKKIKK